MNLKEERRPLSRGHVLCNTEGARLRMKSTPQKSGGESPDAISACATICLRQRGEALTHHTQLRRLTLHSRRVSDNSSRGWAEFGVLSISFLFSVVLVQSGCSHYKEGLLNEAKIEGQIVQEGAKCKTKKLWFVEMKRISLSQEMSLSEILKEETEDF